VSYAPYQEPDMIFDKKAQKMKIFKPNRGKDFVKGSERAGEITSTYMSDDFTGNDGDPPNPTKWVEVDIGGSYYFPEIISIQNNKLDFNVDIDIAEPKSAGMYSISSFSAPFEIEIDWEYLSSLVTIGACLFALGISSFGRINNPYMIYLYVETGGVCKIGVGEYGHVSILTSAITEISGKFKIVIDSDENIKAYYNINDQWEWDGDTDGYSFVETMPLSPTQWYAQFYTSSFAYVAPVTCHVTFDNFIGPAIGVESNRAMYVFDKEAQPKVFKSFNKKVRRPKIWR